jgi:hypothetical protein
MPASTSGRLRCHGAGWSPPQKPPPAVPLRLIPIVRDAVVVKRVDKAVHYADAKIEKGERIVQRVPF